MNGYFADASGTEKDDARGEDPFGGRDETRRLRYVPCECCGGTGEIICRDGEYRSGWPEPHEYAILCSACEGYGTDCVGTEPVEMDDLDTNQPPIK